MTMPYSGLLPLIRHFQADSPLACVPGHIVTAQQFINHASQLASRLPHGRYVLNICEDRYNFLVGFAAALLAKQVTLMPSSWTQHAIAQAHRDFDGCYCLSDQPIPAGLHGYQMTSPLLENEHRSFAVPGFPANQQAAILFTSGSTGQPTAHPKTWGMMVQGADQLQQAFGAAPGSYVIGTVPPQHMFGLESTIMFPLQWGCAIHHGRPHLPADIEQAVSDACAPVWLMTTPLHLRACVAEAPGLSGVVGAISATMPIDQTAAQAAEQILHCPLHEIYGCTEAGIVASRRPAQQPIWRLCPDFQLRQDDAQDWLEGPRVTQALALSDRILMHGPGHFSLQGRLGDIIKIAGKRTTLTGLNSALLTIDGIDDGTFYRLSSGNGDQHDDQRLTAFFVSKQLTPPQVATALRERVDPAFIPRPLWKVEQLPRDANGKLPRASLAALAAALSSESAAASPLRREGVIAADHPALEGHFPGNPLVPGVMLLSDVMRLAAERHTVSGIKQAKFHAPLRPGQSYAISVTESAPRLVKFTIHHGQTMIASGVLHLRGAAHA
jgi:acyl-CoA synthetase (AMP-forming)/AMP-acid ligase II